MSHHESTPPQPGNQPPRAQNVPLSQHPSTHEGNGQTQGKYDDRGHLRGNHKLKGRRQWRKKGEPFRLPDEEGFARMPFALQELLTPAQQAVLNAMQRGGGKNRRCIMSDASIAIQANVSRRTAQRTLEQLVEAGHIVKVDDPHNPTGRAYLLVWMDIWLPPDQKSVSASKRRTRASASNCPPASASNCPPASASKRRTNRSSSPDGEEINALVDAASQDESSGSSLAPPLESAAEKLPEEEKTKTPPVLLVFPKVRATLNEQRAAARMAITMPRKAPTVTPMTLSTSQDQQPILGHFSDPPGITTKTAIPTCKNREEEVARYLAWTKSRDLSQPAAITREEQNPCLDGPSPSESPSSSNEAPST